MNNKIKLLVASVVIAICTLFIVPQVQAILNGSTKADAASRGQEINPRPGPEADPTLRHCPGCYDYDTATEPFETLP